MIRKRGLGKGLDALLNAGVEDEDARSTVAESERLGEVEIDKIFRSRYQPRQRFDDAAIQELAQSIRSQGVLQPIVLRSRETGGYEIIAGERRWRAAQAAGLQRIPAIVRDVSDEQAMAIALIENLQREDLNPLEEARALARLQDEFGLTQQEVADAVGKSRTAVTNLIRLNNLAPGAADLLEQGSIDMGHARALLALPSQDQEPAARGVASRGLSVRQTEALVKRLLAPAKLKTADVVDADTRRLENELSEKIGAPVSIRYVASGKDKGKGQLVIRYNSMDELEGILRHLR